jgi:predicted nicotinamide N-methyase
MRGVPPAPASPALRASLAERLRQLRGGADPLPEVVDAALEEVELPGGPAVVAKPADWPALREAEKAAGRDAPYWAVLWPSGLALAAAVARRAPAGLRVLELGCGLALPSLAAARAGAARVLATDANADAVAYAAHTLALNGALGDVALADWRDLPEEPWDLVLAADVLYTREAVESLVRVLPRLLAPGGEAWIADPGRAGAAEFLPVARRLWRLESEPLAAPVTLHRLLPRA